MKLKFGKKPSGDIFVKVGEKNFSTKDYIRMVKEIKKGKKIGKEFGKNITREEQKSVESMLEEINSIRKQALGDN